LVSKGGNKLVGLSNQIFQATTFQAVEEVVLHVDDDEAAGRHKLST
jgi:hypothetical protein